MCGRRAAVTRAGQEKQKLSSGWRSPRIPGTRSSSGSGSDSERAFDKDLPEEIKAILAKSDANTVEVLEARKQARAAAKLRREKEEEELAANGGQPPPNLRIGETVRRWWW